MASTMTRHRAECRSVTAAWQLIVAPVSCTLYHVSRVERQDNQHAVRISGIQIEAVDGQSNTAPGEYVSVGVLAAPYNGAALRGRSASTPRTAIRVAANVVTETTGTAIPAATLLGYVAENQGTNLCLQSQTFDNAEWRKRTRLSRRITSLRLTDHSQRIRLTDDATNAEARVYQAAISVTSDNHVTLQRLFKGRERCLGRKVILRPGKRISGRISIWRRERWATRLLV